MKLEIASLKWALKNIKLYDDTDLFPLPEEFRIIWDDEDKFIGKIKDIDISNYNWNNSRRFIVPKSDTSYRLVTQLYPTDSILLTALIYQIGQKIEDKRIPQSDKRVFTYRFCPSNDGYMYSRNNSWIDYWKEGIRKSGLNSYAVTLDISDFYNQIYHHTIENELGGCGLPNPVIKSINNLLNSTTQRVSRGIPIGPYPVHLLAELSLIPIDDSLLLRGYDFIRFADDYIFFTDSEEKARSIIYEFATILDKEQRLSIQNQKTKILSNDEFRILANDKISNEPISSEEQDLMAMLKRKSGGDPYANIRLYELEPREIALLKSDVLENLLDSYLNTDDIDYSKIRWIYRRLSQVGTPTLIKFSITNFDRLLPAVNDVCHYLLSAKDSYDDDWKDVGDKALVLLESTIVRTAVLSLAT